jgi:hypothetical protein
MHGLNDRGGVEQTAPDQRDRMGKTDCPRSMTLLCLNACGLIIGFWVCTRFQGEIFEKLAL